MQVDYVDLDAGNRALLDRIAEGVFDNPIDAGQLQRFLDDPNHLMRLAVVDATVVGMASGTVLFHPDKKPQLFINEVGMAAACRQRGIGRRLVGDLVAQARRRGCDYAWLGTEVDNTAGRACFSAVRGAREAGQFILYEWILSD